MSGNCPVSGLEDITQPISIGDLMIISQDTSSGFMSAQMNVGEFLSQVFEENSTTGGKLSDLATELADLENRVGVLETNQAIKDLVEAVFHVGSKHMTTSLEWNPGEALRKFFGKRTNWVLYPYVPYGVVSENVPLGGIVPLLKGTGRSAANLRIWERLPDNAGNYRVNITPDKTAINEGDTVTFTITMIGVEPGTLVNYQFLAIDAADLDPNSEAKLEGSFVNSGSGVNTLTLKTVPNRRNDGDRIVSLNIPSYQAIGTFVLVDSSKALDGVINVLPGTSQLITLAPNQQADVWITGGGGSGGISKAAEAEVVKEVNFLSQEVRGGNVETIAIAAGEEVELWLWGGGGDGATAWKATYTLPPKCYGNGKPSKVTIGSAVFVAGGGLGYLESSTKVQGVYRYIETHLPGGTNSIVSGDYGGLEVTVLENSNGGVGSDSRFFISTFWKGMKLPALQYGTFGKTDIIGNAHGSGGTGNESTLVQGMVYKLAGGGSGGFIKLRVKNPTNSLINITAEAGERGFRNLQDADIEQIATQLMWFSLGAQAGAVQVIRGSTNTIVKVDPTETKDIVIPAGKSAEIWIAGGGGASPFDINTLTKGSPSEITIGSAKYIANGGGNSAYFPGSGSGGPEPGPVPGVNTIPTSGLPAGVTVDVLLNQAGKPTEIVKNVYNVWDEYVCEKSYIYGYGPFAGAANTLSMNIVGLVNRAPAAGSLMKLLVKNNNTTPLTIPAKVGAQSIALISLSENPGVFVDKYEVQHIAHGSPGVVLAFVEGDTTSNSGNANYIKSSIKGGVTENVVLPAGEEIELWLWGGGGSSGCPKFNNEWIPKNGDGGNTRLLFEGNSYIAGGGKGHDEALQKSFGNGWYAMDVNRPGGVNTILTPNVLSGVVISVIENKAGVIGTKATTAFSKIYGALGHPDKEGDCIGSGGTGETFPVGAGATATTVTLGGGGSGGFLRLRIKNNRTQSITLPITTGAGGSRSNKDYFIMTGNNGSEGLAQILEFKSVDVIQPALNTNSTFTLPKGKSAEIWLVGGGAPVYGIIFDPATILGKPSSVTIGSAKYIAGGATSASNLSEVGKTTVPTSGLPTGVEVSILENRAGAKPIITPVVNGRASITQEIFNIKGYGPFGATPDAVRWLDTSGLTYVSVGAGGALLALKVTNNSDADLVIPYELGNRLVSDTLPAEGTVDTTPQAFGGKPTVLVFIDGGGTSSSVNNIMVTDTTKPTTVSIPAGYEMEFTLYGPGGGGGSNSTFDEAANQDGKDGEATYLTVGSTDIIAGGGKGGIRSSARKSGLGGEPKTPASGFPTGVVVSYVEVLKGSDGLEDPFSGDFRFKQQLGGVGYTENGLVDVGIGGNSNVGGGILYQTGGSGGAGARVIVKVKNENALAIDVKLTIGKGGAGGISRNDLAAGIGKVHGFPGNNGAAIYSQVIVQEDSVGYNGEWSYVAFQSPLISGSSSPYIEDIYWATDEAGNNRIMGSNPYGAHAYLIIKTTDVDDSVILSLGSSGLTQEEMGGGELGKEITIPITKIGTTNKGIGSYLIQTLDDDEMSFRNSKYVNMTAERQAGVDYTNNTDYTIEVILMVSDVGTVKPFKVTVGDYAPVDVRDLGGVDYDQQFTVKVPPGVKYRVDANGNIIRKWSELRYKGLK